MVGEHNPAEEHKPWIGDWLELFWKAAIGLSTGCYLSGFLIVHIHLSQYGYFPANPLLLGYFTAGTLALVPILVLWAVIAFWEGGYWITVLLDDSKPAWLFALLIVGGIVCFGGLFAETFTPPSWPGRVPLFFRIGWFCVAGFWIPLLVYNSIDGIRSIPEMYRIIKKLQGDRKRNQKSPTPLDTLASKAVAGYLLLPAITLLYFFFYAVDFSRRVYADIAPQIGGGKPRMVRLIAKKESLENLRAAGISFEANSNVSTPQRLLLGTEKEYVVLAADGATATSITVESLTAVHFERAP